MKKRIAIVLVLLATAAGIAFAAKSTKKSSLSTAKSGRTYHWVVEAKCSNCGKSFRYECDNSSDNPDLAYAAARSAMTHGKKNGKQCTGYGGSASSGGNTVTCRTITKSRN